MNTLMNAVETTVTSNVVLNDKPAQAVGNSNVVVNATKLLASMEAKRITWEQGAYRTSNLELYKVLADCLLFAGELTVAESKQRNTALEAFFTERGYKYKKDSHIIARVVRAVFGNIDRRRISTYVLVLRQAQKSKVEATQLAQWIEDGGGIQEIKLARSATFISPTGKASIAKADFENLPVLAIAKSEQLSQLADAGYVGEDCVLIAEQLADGGFAIRALVRKEGAVNAAFTALYGDIKSQEIAAKKEVNAANDADGAIAKQA
ncbi:hypothetical protein [Polynucleobacter sp. AP-Kaivos-20-H2]|uniref:hypothetical protein n=1 Tax=Polynucleobacter sp. AP-Kaivos-20-H2 TaxID=2689104 RepID=UPI001C0BA3A5|nr:hypothetical protein [Polynucleobacter sp. AP-Kaivos-20-H2]MBU3604496.1 hypothetical protein [Polynucleobacter sp. AP-Kaivos-20-H2]